MKDDFVSVEHLLLAFLSDKRFGQLLFRNLQLAEKTLKVAVKEVRGNQRLCTIPLDTAKVRLQLQKRAILGEGAGAPKYRGMIGTVTTIAREEGLSALWKGIIPGLHRQFIYGGLRIGLYEPVKAFLGSDLVGNVSLFQKILAALITGAIAIAVANPTDLVKVRLQAEGKLPAGVARRYSGALSAYYTIVQQEGLSALWTGLGANIARNATINAAELASYDHVKETIMQIPGFSDNIFTHLLAGLGAGFFAVCIGSPLDVDSPMLSSAQQYLKLRCLGTPAVLLSLAMQGVFHGFKDTQTPLYATCYLLT